ncbi:MAG: DUF2752 domain-containing protein [Chitinophagales bacterium]|jgi:hypothetical protein|nr:DUF2752 domain-containing protein [Bacteroidota bacterium]MBK9557273.1 DUF2752 domain-containing protein [Bacteroidota bacterium]MBL0280436.1 DUF2752 domain-containing protein [Bacteroidota bacterium]MBP8249143.1 DUF2752 domain-containing protein [Chitinophagales bacterium]MBP9880746.1 DUF2752 domain-containing protein [Chitinophagales bacterium]
MIKQLKYNKSYNIAYIGGLLLIPLVLIALPADFFDTGQSICLSVVLLDTECYGCGMTRAIQHLVHLDFHTAAGFNKLAFIVAPLLIFLMVSEIRKCYKRIQMANKRARS